MSGCHSEWRAFSILSLSSFSACRHQLAAECYSWQILGGAASTVTHQAMLSDSSDSSRLKALIYGCPWPHQSGLLRQFEGNRFFVTHCKSDLSCLPSCHSMVPRAQSICNLVGFHELVLPFQRSPRTQSSTKPAFSII